MGIETKFHNPLDGMAINSLEDIEIATEKLREAWGLGTDAISNVIELLEDHHVKVIEIDSEESFDGFATWVNGKDILLIVLNIENQTT